MIHERRQKYDNNVVVREVKRLAQAAHAKVGQTYDGKPYFSEHILAVYEFALKYLYLVPEDFHVRVLCAVLLHDVLEDCPTVYTYNDLRKAVQDIYIQSMRLPSEDAFDEANEIVEIVWGVTNSAGRNRKERADDAFYERLHQRRFADFVKVCDRLANAFASYSKNKGMSKVYMTEYRHFKDKLFKNLLLAPMFHELDIYLESPEDFVQMKFGTLVYDKTSGLKYAVEKVNIRSVEDTFDVIVHCVGMYVENSDLNSRERVAIEIGMLTKVL